MLFSQRQQSYINAYDYDIIPKLFIAVVLKIRSFERLIRNLEKPICDNFQLLLESATIKTLAEIQDAIFGYFYQDKFIFYLKNDNEIEPWHHNKVQNICSAFVTQLTLQFYKEKFRFDLDLNGEALFRGQVYILPSLDESVNDIDFYQKNCIANSIGSAAEYTLIQKYGKKFAYSMLLDKSVSDKKSLLSQAGVDWDSYPDWFRFGSAVYKVPTLPNSELGKVRKKWIANKNLQLISDNHDWYSTILKNGSDIFRAENLF